MKQNIRPKISVVVPCYNASAFLEQNLTSLIRQSYKPDEIIVVDDCSSDGSSEIAERLGVKVIKLEKN